MKRKIIPGIMIVSLMFAGCANAAAEEAFEPVEKEATPVETTRAVKKTIERELLYSGQVKPIEQLSVSPKLGGKVTVVNYDIGDYVNKGEVLFSIDGTDLQNSVNAAAAQYNASLSGVETAKTSLETVSGAQAESQIMQMETAVKNADLAIQNSELQIKNAQIALDNVKSSYQNMKVLYEAGAVPKAEFDKIELSYNQALSGIDAAHLANTQAQIGKLQAQEALDLYISKTKGSAVKQAQSGVNQAAASAQGAKVQLDNATKSMEDLYVRSPISGVVTAKNVDAGILTSPGVPAFTIIDMSSIEVNVNVSEELINVISTQMKVPVVIKSIKDEPFEGVISTISPAAEEAKNTYPVKIRIDNPNGILKPGMFAEVHFTKEKGNNNVVLPRNTVLDEDESKYVFVDEDGIAKKYFVETGIDNGREIEIVSGIPQNAMVITKGQTKVADSEKIKVVGSN